MEFIYRNNSLYYKGSSEVLVTDQTKREQKGVPLHTNANNTLSNYKKKVKKQKQKKTASIETRVLT